MTAPQAPPSLSARLIPPDIRIGRFSLRPYGPPDSEGRFRWRLHGPGSMGIVRRFVHTHTHTIVAVATEAANREGLDLGSDRATVTSEDSMATKRLPVSPSPEKSAAARKGGLARAAKAAAAKAQAAPVAEAKPPKVATTEPDTAIRDALDANKALPDGHPGHAVRAAIRTAGAAGLRTGLEEASRLRAELAAIVTSSGVRIDDAEDVEPVEAIRRVIAALRGPEPTSLDAVERALSDLDARRQALLDRRSHLAAVSRARARLALAEETARIAAAELEAARAEMTALA